MSKKEELLNFIDNKSDTIPSVNISISYGDFINGSVTKILKNQFGEQNKNFKKTKNKNSHTNNICDNTSNKT